MLLINIHLFFSVTFQNVKTIDIRLHPDTAEDMLPRSVSGLADCPGLLPIHGVFEALLPARLMLRLADHLCVELQFRVTCVHIEHVN